MYYNRKFSQKSRLQINRSKDKQRTSWSRTLYYHFCDLTKISNKHRLIQRYIENEQFTVDFCSHILMSWRKYFTNGYTLKNYIQNENFQDKTVQPFSWFDTNVTETQSDAELYQKNTVHRRSLPNYFHGLKKIGYKWIPIQNYVTKKRFEVLKCSTI